MDAGQLLERKNRMGRAASYRKIAKKTGHSHNLVALILSGKHMPFEIDRPAILRKIERALVELELESLQESD